MAADNSKALEALKEAIALEEEGKEFYLKAAEAAQDQAAKEMFRSLAEDEENHLKLFQKQYDSLSSSDKWVAIPEAKGAKVSPNPPVFPETPSEGPKTSGNPADLQALVTGMEVEVKSFAHYNLQAATASDMAAKEMYWYIASQEQSHFNTLMMRYQSFSMTPNW